MKVPLEVKHKHLVARIVYAPSDHLYHSTFTVGGKRIKRAAKTLEKAKSVILEAMKQACKGRSDIASLSGRQLDELNTAVSLAKANGHQNLLSIVQRYLAFEHEAEGMDIFMAIAQFKLSRTCVQAVPFKQAAQGWFDSRKGRWADDTFKEKQKRLPKVTNAFQIDVCDITHEAIELFFKDLQTLSPKTRNHFREILRGILKYSVDREWLEHDRCKRLDTLLKSESTPSAAPKILTLPEFTYLLENADHELLPMIALGRFAGIRPAEIRRMRWEHVWSRESGWRGWRVLGGVIRRASAEGVRFALDGGVVVLEGLGDGGAVEVFAEGDGRFGFQVADLRENGLAHFAFGHKPVGDRHRAALFVMGLGVSAVFAGSKFIGKGSMPTSRNAVKFSRRCSIS